jgi:hypothetical protein
VALGFPGRLRPRFFSTFGTTRVVGRQPNAPAAFTPGEIRGTHFQRLSRPQGTWFCRKEPRKKSQVTRPGIDSGTVRLVAQRLNRYATTAPPPHFFKDFSIIQVHNVWKHHPHRFLRPHYVLIMTNLYFKVDTFHQTQVLKLQNSFHQQMNPLLNI